MCPATAVRKYKWRIGRRHFPAPYGLKHLYFRLEEAKLDLHSACDGCYEIRNFLNTPNYRGNRNDPVGVEYHRPLTEYDNDYAKAVTAEAHVIEKATAPKENSLRTSSGSSHAM